MKKSKGKKMTEKYGQGTQFYTGREDGGGVLKVSPRTSQVAKDMKTVGQVASVAGQLYGVAKPFLKAQKGISKISKFPGGTGSIKNKTTKKEFETKQAAADKDLESTKKTLTSMKESAAKKDEKNNEDGYSSNRLATDRYAKSIEDSAEKTHRAKAYENSGRKKTDEETRTAELAKRKLKIKSK